MESFPFHLSQVKNLTANSTSQLSPPLTFLMYHLYQVRSLHLRVHLKQLSRYGATPKEAREHRRHLTNLQLGQTSHIQATYANLGKIKKLRFGPLGNQQHA